LHWRSKIAMLEACQFQKYTNLCGKFTAQDTVLLKTDHNFYFISLPKSGKIIKRDG
jgi:hypothetical protein